MKIFDEIVDIAAKAIDEENEKTTVDNGAATEATEATSGKKKSLVKWGAIVVGGLTVLGLGYLGGKKLLKKKESANAAEGEIKEEVKDEKKK